VKYSIIQLSKGYLEGLRAIEQLMHPINDRSVSIAEQRPFFHSLPEI